MLMKTAHFNRLLGLLEREASPRSTLIMARRIVRHVIDSDDQLRQDMARNVRALKIQLPFSKARLVHYQDACDALLTHNAQVLCSFGRVLRDSCRWFEAGMTFDELCDVLCVSQVRRASLAASERGLLELTYAMRLEDSATHAGEPYHADNAPITRAIEAVMHEWLLQNAHQLPDPWAPGGPFYGAPIYHEDADGTMVQATPALTAHTGANSEVVASRRERQKSTTQGKVASVSSINPNMTRQE